MPIATAANHVGINIFIGTPTSGLSSIIFNHLHRWINPRTGEVALEFSGCLTPALDMNGERVWPPFHRPTSSGDLRSQPKNF
jgi:hypothetical protein